MFKREYYSVRTGKINPSQEISFEVFKRLFLAIYNKLDSEGYYQKYFGYDCVDGDEVGSLGADLEAALFLSLKKEGLYPIKDKISAYSEDDLFDVIEFLHDSCSKGLEGRYHNFNDCGFHFHEFDDLEGQKYFREQFNPLLKDYGQGYEISGQGEILFLAEEGLSNLLEAEIPTDDKDNIEVKVHNAILKFRRYKASVEDRKEAIRELADVLEYLRPEVKKYLNKQDEADLFNIANNFGIRHHNKKQKTDYDRSIWFSWIFYHYLATIHALLRIIQK